MAKATRKKFQRDLELASDHMAPGEDPTKGYVRYATHDGTPGLVCSFMLSRSEWLDLGSPEQITVTVEH